MFRQSHCLTSSLHALEQFPVEVEPT